MGSRNTSTMMIVHEKFCGAPEELDTAHISRTSEMKLLSKFLRNAVQKCIFPFF